MTKNEIIRELAKSNPNSISYLCVIYHNPKARVDYVYSYNNSFLDTAELRKELARVILSLYRLRKYVVSIRVVYYRPTPDSDFVNRFFDSFNYVYSVSDFIKTIKK